MKKRSTSLRRQLLLPISPRSSITTSSTAQHIVTALREYVMTHCKEAKNLSTAPFHGLYFRFSTISMSLYGFHDHPRIRSDPSCYQIGNRLGLRRAYYKKTPWIIIKIIKINEKKVGILDAKILQKRGYMKVHLSYPTKDMSYASIGDDTVWPFESAGPIVGWSTW